LRLKRQPTGVRGNYNKRLSREARTRTKQFRGKKRGSGNSGERKAKLNGREDPIPFGRGGPRLNFKKSGQAREGLRPLKHLLPAKLKGEGMLVERKRRRVEKNWGDRSKERTSREKVSSGAHQGRGRTPIVEQGGANTLKRNEVRGGGGAAKGYPRNTRHKEGREKRLLIRGPPWGIDEGARVESFPGYPAGKTKRGLAKVPSPHELRGGSQGRGGEKP